jgi:hypothetical protein
MPAPVFLASKVTWPFRLIDKLSNEHFNPEQSGTKTNTDTGSSHLSQLLAKLALAFDRAKRNQTFNEIMEDIPMPNRFCRYRPDKSITL